MVRYHPEQGDPLPGKPPPRVKTAIFRKAPHSPWMRGFLCIRAITGTFHYPAMEANREPPSLFYFFYFILLLSPPSGVEFCRTKGLDGGRIPVSKLAKVDAGFRIQKCDGFHILWAEFKIKNMEIFQDVFPFR